MFTSQPCSNSFISLVASISSLLSAFLHAASLSSPTAFPHSILVALSELHGNQPAVLKSTAEETAGTNSHLDTTAQDQVLIFGHALSSHLDMTHLPVRSVGKRFCHDGYV